MIPHMCVHCRAIEKWTFRVPGSNDACLTVGKEAVN